MDRIVGSWCVIDEGDTVTIPGGLTLTIGALTTFNQGAMHVGGTFVIDGTFTNQGAIDSGHISEPFVFGNIVIKSGVFTNYGSVPDVSTGRHLFIENSAGGLIYNYGSMSAGTTVLRNYGSFKNEGQLHVRYSGNPPSLFDNEGILSNRGAIVNDDVFSNQGAIDNLGSFANTEYLANDGSITNFGSFTNAGGASTRFTNQGVFANACGGRYEGDAPEGAPIEQLLCQFLSFIMR